MQFEKLGPYRIGKQIGKGGMGAVYEATHELHDSERVAIKSLSPQLAMAEGFRERFEAEIDSLKKLRHENIVRLFGYGEQDGTLFYSMELVEGTSLEEELVAGRRFDWRETIHIAIQICHALKHAHDHGVVHRDIKPANILLAPDNRIKIADFGIARLFGGTQLTTAGGVLGTADYMSPEQADGRPVTDRCDQYSLGGVLYALLAGRPPFRAKSMPEMLQLQRFADPEPVSRYAPDTPVQFEQLIHQLLAKDPEDRFPNVMVLGRHMEAMEKALSRPVTPQEHEPNIKIQNLTSDRSPTDATADFAKEATSSTSSPIVLPHDNESGEAPFDLYDAPTLDQPIDLTRNKANVPTQITTSTPEEQRTTGSRFITVDEDARRERERARGSRLVLAGQLGGLLFALAVLVWIGWRLMQPATADELFSKISTVLSEQGEEGLRSVSSEIKEYFERFPDDPRAVELAPWRERLEYQKFERNARRKSRMNGGKTKNPIERKYYEAMAIAENDPSQSLAILQSLLALYDPEETAASQLPSKSEDANQRWLALTRRQIERLTQNIAELTATQLPALRERLAAAAKRQKSDPATAAKMYQAIVDLYGNQSWAEEIVKQAQHALNTEDLP
ncbi:MAG: serine/threonine protein kinase [Planctomycetes bacterium]|nr:serine/threonine protein kinase [Planctomycetota bacterium]